MDVEKEVRTFSRLNWITGEVHISKGLDESLALSRDSFTWSQDYQEFKERFHKILTRMALWVERVASTEKKLIEAFEKKYEIPTTSTSELISVSLKRLESAGFEINHKLFEEVRGAKYPVSIEKNLMKVTVIDDHPAISDIIEVPTGKVGIKYVTFEREVRDTEPVRLSSDGSIEINTAYPVFTGKTKGDLMKRLHLIMFLAKQECETAEDMYEYIIKEIRDEFG